MNDHPLGDVDGTDAPPPAPVPSILDTILDLDAYLSSEVRRAEKSARFCTEPQLEADIENLNAELDSLVDANGRPLADVEADLAGTERSARTVALEIQEKQREYAAAFRTVRLRAMTEDDWKAFQAKHKSALEKGAPYPNELYEELIVACAVAPAFTVEQVRAFRAQAGPTAFEEVSLAAWRVNATSGVDIPKSSLSSAVLRLTEPAKS